eukprot:4238392-Prymnesium_polylepis.2
MAHGRILERVDQVVGGVPATPTERSCSSINRHAAWGRQRGRVWGCDTKGSGPATGADTGAGSGPATGADTGANVRKGCTVGIPTDIIPRWRPCSCQSRLRLDGPMTGAKIVLPPCKRGTACRVSMGVEATHSGQSIATIRRASDPRILRGRLLDEA